MHVTSHCAFLAPLPLARFSSALAGTPVRQSQLTLELVIRPNTTRCREPLFPQLKMKAETKKNPILIFGAWVLVGGLVLTSFLPAFNIMKQAFTGRDNSAYMEKVLSPVPVFTVTDEAGRPLLRDLGTNDGFVGFFFTDPNDAMKYKSEIGEEYQGRIITIGLNEAMKFVERRVDLNQLGQKEHYKIVGSKREQNLARAIASDAKFKSGVPLFWIEGLAFEQKGDKPLYPLYFEKETLNETLEQAQKQGLGLKADDVQVTDLIQTLKEIRSGGDERLQSVILLPSRDALRYRQEHMPKDEPTTEARANQAESQN